MTVTFLTAASPLFKMFYSALIAGVGVSIVFSIAILGAVRSSDMRRSGRTTAATGYALLAACALVVSAAVVVYGLILVGHKG
jgi:multisubunit Na+/H+ antiporter MnhE subunit